MYLYLLKLNAYVFAAGVKEMTELGKLITHKSHIYDHMKKRLQTETIDKKKLLRMVMALCQNGTWHMLLWHVTYVESQSDRPLD